MDDNHFRMYFVLCLVILQLNAVFGIFRSSRRWLDTLQTTQLNNGIAATDVNDDGLTDWFVAGYNGRNFVLSYNQKKRRLENLAQRNTPYEALMDEQGAAMGVCACDIDGDGREEIYVMNTNDAYGGQATYRDKLFIWRKNRWIDILSNPINADVNATSYAGRSVGCIDRYGTGYYSFILSTYSSNGDGEIALIGIDHGHPMNDDINGILAVSDAANSSGIARATGGRSLLVGPILNNYGSSDIYFGNEGNSWLGNTGENFLFANQRDGMFVDVADEKGVADYNENARGMAFGDFNEDGMIDIVVGNWRGYNKIYQQTIEPINQTRSFNDIAPPSFKEPLNVRNVMVADFDNDGRMEIFFNNICDKWGQPQPNKLFRVNNKNKRFSISGIDIGDAREAYGCGTGASYADVDGDGRLDVLISHGESKQQPLSVYNAYKNSRRRWIRIIPTSVFGAPARGALVQIDFNVGEHMTQVIDGGSGYLCQMEPAAHFGLGETRTPTVLFIQWPDGSHFSRVLTISDLNKEHYVSYNRATYGR